MGGGELYGRPVAWVGVGPPERGAGAERSLAEVLGYLGADVAACARVPVPRELVQGDGAVHDPQVREALRAGLTTLAGHVRGLRSP